LPNFSVFGSHVYEIRAVDGDNNKMPCTADPHCSCNIFWSITTNSYHTLRLCVKQ